MQFIVWWVGQHRVIEWGVRYRVQLGLGEFSHNRLQALTGLLRVATEGLGRSKSVLAGVLVSETRP